jgi:glycosyltransferase involved in cell wall biosynthesis
MRVDYLATRSAGRWAHLEYQIRAITRIRRSHRDADVVHFHSEPEGALLSSGLRAMRVLSYDNFYFRGGRDSRLYPLFRRALLTYDLLLPCSEYCEHASTAYWHLPADHTRVLVNGVNLEQFRPDSEAAERERTRVAPGDKVVVYLGRVCNQKGTDTLLQAYAKACQMLPQTTLLIAGPIDEFEDTSSSRVEKEWRSRMQDAGATYLGAVHEDRLPGLLNLADVFVMPTRVREMFGMAALEAQACGTPVIASDHGGLREVVPDDAGRRFPPGDAGALAELLGQILSDDALRDILGRGAAENAQRYGWDRVAAEFEAIYSTHIAGRHV